jgi:hypothetical protein
VVVGKTVQQPVAGLMKAGIEMNAVSYEGSSNPRISLTPNFSWVLRAFAAMRTVSTVWPNRAQCLVKTVGDELFEQTTSLK